jgi:hypothetical protein
MIYPEKAYTAAGQALARATTEQAAKARARIIELMTYTEQPADRARARELATEGEEEPPGLGARLGPPPFFLSGCEADPSPPFSQTKIQNQMFPQANNPLTQAYVLGTRVTTHESMAQAARLIRELEKSRTGCEIDQCKLAAEVLVERKQA